MDNPFKRYRNLLTTYIDSGAIFVLYKNWNSPKRHYHNMDHLKSVIGGIEKWSDRLTREEYEQLILAAFFHDAIYDPRDRRSNEDRSKKFFREAYIGTRDFELVEKAIDCTKERKRPNPGPLRYFWEADNAVFRKDWLRIIRWEFGIRKEYSFVHPDTYKEHRIKFLKKNLGLFGPKGDANINKLIKYLDDK